MANLSSSTTRAVFSGNGQSVESIDVPLNNKMNDNSGGRKHRQPFLGAAIWSQSSNRKADTQSQKPSQFSTLKHDQVGKRSDSSKQYLDRSKTATLTGSTRLCKVTQQITKTVETVGDHHQNRSVWDDDDDFKPRRNLKRTGATSMIIEFENSRRLSSNAYKRKTAMEFQIPPEVTSSNNDHEDDGAPSSYPIPTRNKPSHNPTLNAQNAKPSKSARSRNRSIWEDDEDFKPPRKAVSLGGEGNPGQKSTITSKPSKPKAKFKSPLPPEVTTLKNDHSQERTEFSIQLLDRKETAMSKNVKMLKVSSASLSSAEKVTSENDHGTKQRDLSKSRGEREKTLNHTVKQGVFSNHTRGNGEIRRLRFDELRPLRQYDLTHKEEENKDSIQQIMKVDDEDPDFKPRRKSFWSGRYQTQGQKSAATSMSMETKQQIRGPMKASLTTKIVTMDYETHNGLDNVAHRVFDNWKNKKPANMCTSTQQTSKEKNNYYQKKEKGNEHSDNNNFQTPSNISGPLKLHPKETNVNNDNANGPTISNKLTRKRSESSTMNEKVKRVKAITPSHASSEQELKDNDNAILGKVSVFQKAALLNRLMAAEHLSETDQGNNNQKYEKEKNKFPSNEVDDIKTSKTDTKGPPLPTGHRPRKWSKRKPEHDNTKAEIASTAHVPCRKETPTEKREAAFDKKFKRERKVTVEDDDDYFKPPKRKSQSSSIRSGHQPVINQTKTPSHDYPPKGHGTSASQKKLNKKRSTTAFPRTPKENDNVNSNSPGHRVNLPGTSRSNPRTEKMKRDENVNDHEDDADDHEQPTKELVCEEEEDMEFEYFSEESDWELEQEKYEHEYEEDRDVCKLSDQDDEEISVPIGNRCPISSCGRISSSKEKMQQHALNVHNLRLVPCHECGGKLYSNISTHHSQNHGVKTDKKLYGLRKRLITSVKPDRVPVAKNESYIKQQMELVGLPAATKMIIKKEFAVAYNEERKHPMWVFEVFGREVNKGKVDRYDFYYHEEPALGFVQATAEGIRNTGYQVGHLAAAANHKNSRKACEDTFSMCNVVPMNRVVNTGSFRGLEIHTRNLAKENWKVFVVTGLIYSEGSLSCNVYGGLAILVPDAFFKIIVYQNEKETFQECYLITNSRPERPTPFQNYASSISDIEKETGLVFFFNLHMKARQVISNNYHDEKIKESQQDPKNSEEAFNHDHEEQKDNKELPKNDNTLHQDDHVKCPECDFSSSKQSVKEHASAVHKLRLVPCHACEGNLFADIAKHHTTMHGDNQCLFCGQIKNNSIILRRHIRTSHSGLKGHIVFSDKAEDVPLDKDESYIKQQMDLVGVPPASKMIMKNEFAVSYDEQNMHPLWAFEVLGGADNKRKMVRKQFHYHEDSELKFKQITPEAIRHTGLQIGHLAAAGNHCTREKAYKDTFSMCNLVPMNKFVNMGAFEALEFHTRSLTKTGSKVCVVTGPIYSENSSSCYVPGCLEVRIPDAIFKVILVQGGGNNFHQCYIIPNKRPERPTLFHNYATTMEHIEQLTGFKFFHKIQLKTTSDYQFHRCTKFNCHITFTSYNSLQQHQLVQHNGEKRYKCKDCETSFDNPSNLVAHRKSLHIKGRAFVCEECGRAFNTKHHLERHQMIHSGERPFQCDVCEKRFYRSDQLDDHVNVHVPSKSFKCDKCGQTFGTKPHLTKHRKYHDSDRGNKCPICPQSFVNVSYLNEHISKVHSETPSEECPKCKARYVGVHNSCPAKLDRDMIMAHQCSKCPAEFKDLGNLKRHENKCHNPNGPPAKKCEVCGVFYDKTHYKCKAKQKLFSCSDCNWTGPSNNSLLNHRKLHENGSSSKLCEKCKVRYIGNVHARCPMKPVLIHGCDKCNAVFKYKNSLMNHIKNVHADGVKPNHCTVCGVDFIKTHGCTRKSPENKNLQ